MVSKEVISEDKGAYAGKAGRSEERILQALRTHPLSSISEISRLTGLGKATVLRTVSSLRERGIVQDTGQAIRTPGRGRPGRGLRLNPDVGLYVGIAFGPGFMTGVLANSAHEVLAHCQIDVPNPAPVEKNGVAAVQRVIDTLFSGTDLTTDLLIGIGVAAGGPVHPKTGLVSAQSLIPEWADVRIDDVLSKAFDLPVLVENESNCSLLAEAQWGRASLDELTVYFKFDIGVGGAILANGDLVRGGRGQVGEWGHISSGPNGDFCSCGKRGCYGNRIGVLHLLRLAEPVHGKIGIEKAFDLARADDPTITAILQQMGHAAGEMIAQVTEPLDPARIIVGGDLTEMGDAFLTPMRQVAVERGVGDRPIELAAAARMLAGVQQRDEPALGAISLLLRQNLVRS